MSVGDEWVGDFSYTTIVPGKWTVLDWSSCVVMINKVNAADLFSCENTRNISFGAGSCNLKCSDPEKTQYLLFQEGDEIEIYMAETEIANKVWGGYVEGLNISDDRGKILEIQGKEYSSRLLNQTFTDTFSDVELSTAITTIMGNQTDFSLDIPNTISKSVSGTFTDEGMFNALQKFCDQWNYYFWVDVNKVFKMQLQSEITLSADTITTGVNLTRKRKTGTNKEYLCNDVTVKGSGGTSETASDAESQEKYGVHKKEITVASLDTSATVKRYAIQYIASRKDPLPYQELATKFLPYTDPREYMPVDCSELNMNGDFQVTSITHKWGKGQGINSATQFSNTLGDTSRQLGDFERRIRDVESDVF